MTTQHLENRTATPRIAWILAPFLLILVSCGPSVPEIELLPVPTPDLSAAEDTVRTQIGEKSDEISGLLADTGSTAEARAEAFGELGQIFLAYDFLDAAQVCFENAQRLRPEDFRWVYLRGYLHQIQGQLPDAIERLDAALVLQGDYLPAWLRLGRAHLENGAIDPARTAFERALDLDESAAAAHEGLGKIAEASGDLDAAVTSFTRALEIQPGASGLRYALGQVYRRQGDVGRAREELAQSGDVAIAIADPLLSALGQLAASAQFYIMRAGEAMEVQDYPTASASYLQALELDPEFFDAYKGLAYSLEKQGDLEGAIRQLELGIQNGKSEEPEKERLARAELHRILGGLWVLSGRETQAIDSFSKAIEINPEDENARLKLANALARRGTFDAAMTHYDTLLADRPELAAVRILRATALINLRRAAEARQEFERAIADAPDNPQFRLRYADALEFLGDRNAAQAQRTEAASLATTGSAKARSLIDQGRRQLRQEEFEAALGSFRAALEESPEAQDARYQAASVLGHLGRFDEAVGEFQTLLEDNPRHQAARHGEITSLILGQRYGEARMKLNEAMQLFPRDFALAHAQARMMASVPDRRVRDGRLALAVAQKLYEFKTDDPRVLETLAMALAESGRFDEAIQAQGRALELARTRGATALLPLLEAQLESYRSGGAWTFERPEELVAATLGAG